MITKRSARFIGLALAESARSTYERVRIGAVIVDKNYEVSKGANLSTSHPMQYHYNRLTGRKAPAHNLHAEMHTLVKAKDYENLENCEIFIARYDRKGRLAMCRPCIACERALKKAGITRITYTTSRGIHHEQLTRR